MMVDETCSAGGDAPDKQINRLAVRLFGRFEALRGNQPLSGLHLRDGERFLAYLILRAGEPVDARDIARIFWPAEALNNPGGSSGFPSLRQALHVVRHALGEDAYRLTRPLQGTLQLDLTGDFADVAVFDRLTQRENAKNRQMCEEAVSLYRGPLLEDWTDTWAVEARQRFQRRFESILRRLALQARASKQAEEEERWLRRLIDLQSTDEETLRGLLRLLGASHRHAEALEYLDTFHSEMTTRGQTPEAETKRLVDELLRLRERPPLHTAQSPFPSAAANVGLFVPVPPGGEEEIAETDGGAVPIRSRYYIERNEDALFDRALQRVDSIVLVKGARQVGKTSLLARGLHKARQRGGRVVLTDFQKFNSVQLASPDALYRTLAYTIAQSLGIPFSSRDMEDEDAGPNMRMEQFLRQRVLPHVAEPLIWAMDEVDRLFACPFGSEVFGLFRSWHNERALDPDTQFRRLTLAISYATEAQLFITDLNQSPFNVGTRLTLNDFNPDQITDLNERYGAPLTAEALSGLARLVGGQPYLIRRSLNEVANGASIHAILAGADGDGGVFGDHLQRLWASLERATDLLPVLRALIDGNGRPSPAEFYRLRAAGVLAGNSSLEADFRCRLYASFFVRQFAMTPP